MDLRHGRVVAAALLACISGTLAGHAQAVASPQAVPAEPSFTALTAPQRVLDTRSGEVTADGQMQGIGKAAAGATLVVPIAGRVGVPSGAGSVTLNVTVAEPDGPGFAAVFPCGAARPTASNLNFAAAQTIPNAVIAKLGDGGAVCLYSLVAAHYIIDVSGVLPATSFTALTAPQRVLDTRSGEVTADGQMQGIGKAAAGATLVVPVAGRVGVPSGAGSVTLNVTVAEPDGPGFATVFPCGAARPTASNLNFAAAQTIPNAVIAKLGDGGAVCLYSLVAAHYIIDVSGVLPATSFTALTAPQRVLDTRSGEVTADGQMQGIGKRFAGSSSTLPIAGRVGIPADARAVVLNVTVTQPDGPGFATVFPTGVDRPTASNLNYAVGETIPNLVVASLGAGGAACLFTLSSAHYVVDVAGYLTEGPPPDRAVTCPPPQPPALLMPPTQNPAQQDPFWFGLPCRPGPPMAAIERVVINPGLTAYFDDIGPYLQSEALVQQLSYTVMVNSGPMPAAVAEYNEFRHWISNFQRYHPARDLESFLSNLNLAYHETLHVITRFDCVQTGRTTGYSFGYGLQGFPQDQVYADVIARIDAIGAADGLPPTSYVVESARDTALQYLEPGSDIGAAGISSQMTEMVAYDLSAEWGFAIDRMLGRPTSAPNRSITAHKMHQLARYLAAAERQPALFQAMRSSPLRPAIADAWNLMARNWVPDPDDPLDEQQFAWDLAFGPDADVVIRFTDGSAGTIAPPRPS